VNNQDLISEIKKLKYYNQAMTHKSFSNEKGDGPLGSNERLEFLGDAIIHAAIAEELFLKFTKESEGILSKRRAHAVNENSLAEIFRHLNLQSDMKFGKFETKINSYQNSRLQASTFESIVGAYFLEHGYLNTKKAFIDLFKQNFIEDSKFESMDKDYKTLLQEETQKWTQELPVYRVKFEEGPAHKKKFICSVSVLGEELGVGEGLSKKQAEQKAAEEALNKVLKRKK